METSICTVQFLAVHTWIVDWSQSVILKKYRKFELVFKLRHSTYSGTVFEKTLTIII